MSEPPRRFFSDSEAAVFLVQELIVHLAVLAMGLQAGSNLDRERRRKDEPSRLACPERGGLDEQGSAAGRSLRELLRQLSPLDRTLLVTTWASSPHPELRLALVWALPERLDIVGARSALEVLATDSALAVRVAAERALRHA